MRFNSPDSRPSPIQQVVLATCLAGIIIVFILVGRPPGWQVYLASGFLAVAFLITALSMLRWSNWLGVAALASLLLAMFWEKERPASLAAGIILAILSAWRTYQRTRLSDEEEVVMPTEEPRRPESIDRMW